MSDGEGHAVVIPCACGARILFCDQCGGELRRVVLASGLHVDCAACGGTVLQRCQACGASLADALRIAHIRDEA